MRRVAFWTRLIRHRVFDMCYSIEPLTCNGLCKDLLNGKILASMPVSRFRTVLLLQGGVRQVRASMFALVRVRASPPLPRSNHGAQNRRVFVRLSRFVFILAILGNYRKELYESPPVRIHREKRVYRSSARSTHLYIRRQWASSCPISMSLWHPLSSKANDRRPR